MTNRAKTKLASSGIVPPDPKSFSPQSGKEAANAWQQYDRIAKGRGSADREEYSDQLIGLARNSIRARRLRKSVLPNAMFGEPAWDMLLSLYVGARSGARQTVSNLCQSSGGSQTTALRWIDYLEAQEFVKRRGSSTDRRITFIDLTELGHTAIDSYFATLVAQGIATGPNGFSA